MDYTTYKAYFRPQFSQTRQSYDPVDLGEGFKTKTRNKEFLEKHNLLGKDVLSFVNELCFLVDEKKADLPLEEWESLEFSLRALMVTYDGGELYYYLLHAHGAEALNYNAWAHFASDTDWRICVRTFTDMPTDILEEYAAKDWAERTRTTGEEGKKNIIKAISKRTDIYGSHSLPINMVEGILFKN